MVSLVFKRSKKFRVFKPKFKAFSRNLRKVNVKRFSFYKKPIGMARLSFYIVRTKFTSKIIIKSLRDLKRFKFKFSRFFSKNRNSLFFQDTFQKPRVFYNKYFYYKRFIFYPFIKKFKLKRSKRFRRRKIRFSKYKFKKISKRFINVRFSFLRRKIYRNFFSKTYNRSSSVFLKRLFRRKRKLTVRIKKLFRSARKFRFFYGRRRRSSRTLRRRNKRFFKKKTFSPYIKKRKIKLNSGFKISVPRLFRRFKLGRRGVPKLKRGFRFRYFVKLTQTYNNFFFQLGNVLSERIYFTYSAGRVPILRRNRRKTTQTLSAGSENFAKKLRLMKIKKIQLFIVGPYSFFVRKFVKSLKFAKLRIKSVTRFLRYSHNGIRVKAMRRV